MLTRPRGDLRPWLVAIAALAGAALPVQRAWAGPPAGPEPVRFAWVRADGADGCADQQRIAEQVAARLGRSPFSAEAARSIEVVVRGTKHGFHAVLYVRGPGSAQAGSRELTSESADCASIEAASVLAVALTIDPDAGTRAPLPPPPDAGTRAPLPPPPPPAAVAPALRGELPGLGSDLPSAPSGVVVPTLSLLAPPLPVALPAEPAPFAEGVLPDNALGAAAVALRVGAGVGLLPKVAPGVALAAQMTAARAVQITAEALWMPEARTADAHFGFGLTAFSLGACFVPSRLAIAELAVCGSVWGGALHAVVYQLAPVTPGDSGWVAAAASSRLRLRLAAHLDAEVGGHLLVPLTRHPFVLHGEAAPVFQQAPVTFFPFAGLGGYFP